MSAGLLNLECKIEEALKGFEPRLSESVHEWAENNVIIPVLDQKFPGPIDLDKSPYLKAFFDLYWLPTTRDFFLCKSARVGGTFLSLIAALHKIAVWPGPTLFVFPSKEGGSKFSQKELQPFMLETPAVAKKVINSRDKFKVFEMILTDCSVGIVGSGSPAALGGRNAELLIVDELDKLSDADTGESSPLELARVRTKQFEHTCKRLYNSTPNYEENETWKGFMSGSRHYVYLPCPECNKYQRLSFFNSRTDATWEVPFDEYLNPLPKGKKRIEKVGQFYFEHCKDKKGNYDFVKVKSQTKYECAYCSYKIPNSKKGWMLERLKVAPHAPEKISQGIISAHIWAAYSTFESWGQIAFEFLTRAKGDPKGMQNFYNSTLGLPFKEEASNIGSKEIKAIQEWSPKYRRRTLPRKPVSVVMTIDVQGDGYWWVIRALGIIEEDSTKPVWSALVDWGFSDSIDDIKFLAGITPSKEGIYNTFEWEGVSYTVNDGLIDSGYNAQKGKNIYGFCAENSHIFNPSKGSDIGKMRSSSIQESVIEHEGVELTLQIYNDDLMKQSLYFGHMKKPEYNWWLPEDLDNTYKNQLTAETLTDVRSHLGKTRKMWKVIGKEGNHLGDCEKKALIPKELLFIAYNSLRSKSGTDEG